MTAYLQFDSSARSSAYIERNLGSGVVWVPNDNYSNTALPPFNPYQLNKNLVQTPSNYRVFYRELNEHTNKRTIGFLAHCKERPTNLTYSVEGCTVILPASATVQRTDSDGNITYVSILDEPYVYVRLMSINNAEGNLIYSNNRPADQATFVMWLDKIQVGPGTLSPPLVNPVQRPPTEFAIEEFNTAQWIIYKTCMITIMRLDLGADEWQVRIYDRFGNDIIIPESDNGGVGFAEVPEIDPEIQTMVIVGIKPNYPL